MEGDAALVGCATFCFLGFCSLFLTSKPVTMGGVMMVGSIAAVAAHAASLVLPAAPAAAADAAQWSSEPAAGAAGAWAGLVEHSELFASELWRRLRPQQS